VRPTSVTRRLVGTAAPLAVGGAGSKTPAMADPVVPSEYVAHVRAVTAELREL
jgi:hypothetical protein